MTWKPLPSDEPEPVSPINKSIERMSKRLGLTKPSVSDRIFSEWPQLVGTQLAGKCRPVSLVDGILSVEAVDAGWANQLKWLGPQVSTKANQLVESEVVKRIEVRISGGKPRK